MELDGTLKKAVIDRIAGILENEKGMINREQPKDCIFGIVVLQGVIETSLRELAMGSFFRMNKDTLGDKDFEEWLNNKRLIELNEMCYFLGCTTAATFSGIKGFNNERNYTLKKWFKEPKDINESGYVKSAKKAYTRGLESLNKLKEDVQNC